MTQLYRGPTLEVPEHTMPGEFFRVVEEFPDRPGVTTRTPAGDEFKTYTWQEFGELVTRAAHGLIALGVQPGDRVAIQAKTRYEWMVADLAILTVGGITTTVYTTLTPNQTEYILNDAEPRVMFSADQDEFDKVREIHDSVPSLEHVVAFEAVDAGELEKRTLTLNELYQKGDEHASEHPDAVQERLDGVDHEDDATIVYTSGTTGLPKGCVLTHRNFVSAAESSSAVMPTDENDIGLAFLPLAHVYQRLITLFNYRVGARTIFTSPATLGDDLKRFQPTVMASVPRIYEKMYDTVIDKVEAEATGLKKAIFEGASKTATEYGQAISNGGTPGPILKAKHALFDKLVYEKLRENLGAQNMKYVITGAAAMRADLLYWFRGIGVPILEGYGLTETSAPSNVNLPDRFKPGTVGPPLPGIEQKIGDKGEVLMRGPNIFEHYYELEEETDAAFTDDGWFRSGDIGEFDEDGYLRIVDRLKQIEVLSTGKNVAPVPIEEAIKASDWVAEVMVVGSDRKFVTALIQPNYERLLKFADQEGITYDEDAVVRAPDPTGAEVVDEVPTELLEHEKVQANFQNAVDDANPNFSHFEQVKKFRLLPKAITIGRDHLTPTLKKKRRNIRSDWEDLIETMYPEDDA